MLKKIYNLTSVVEITGLSEHLLRAWEKRYQLVKPSRLKNGRRQYQIEDVEKLKTLSLLTQRGHTISSLKKLSYHELQKLLLTHSEDLSEQKIQSLKSLAPKKTNFKKLITTLIQQIQSSQWSLVKTTLYQQKEQLSSDQLILNFISPLLREVGEQVAHHQLRITQEHQLSSVLRTLLGEMLESSQSFQDIHYPTMVFTTTSGELHELGTLCAAVLAASHRYPVHYLGPNLPDSEILAYLKALRFKSTSKTNTSLHHSHLILGFTYPKKINNIKRTILHLHQNAPSSISFMIGGPETLIPMVAQLKNSLDRNIELISLSQWNDYLKTETLK